MKYSIPEKIVLLSRRDLDKSPAGCCMAELENILIEEYGAELISLPALPNNVRSGVTIFCVLLAFYEFGLLEEEFAKLRRNGCRIVVYFFDCWDAPQILYNRRRQLRDRLKPSLRLEETVDRICLPFHEIYDALQPRHQYLAMHVPLAADSSLVDGYNTLRPISVLAYGRQPSEITHAIADSINCVGSSMIFHHTDHFTIAQINDQRVHRMHFWKMAQSSQIALAYDPKITSPHRVPISIVGQRWYESLAAGCVVVGRRPKTAEVDELLNWPEATIELPNEPAEAVEFLRALLGDHRRIAAIRERNVEQMRARHDWRHRIPRMLAENAVAII